MARGSSRVVRRSRRKRVIRRAAWWSSLWRSRRAPSSSSILQAKVAFHFVERVGPRPAFAEVDQALLGQVHVL